MDQPGAVARASSEEVRRRENETFPVLTYGIPPYTVQLVRRANCPCCSRVTCLRTGQLDNCTFHFNGFLSFNRPLPAAAFRTAD